MKNTGTLNYQWAFSLIHYLSLHGITQAVISPGSRSTPLALACEQHPNIRTWVQIDERSAGFFALGLSQIKHIPSLLICTSGSAVTNWFPAVVEANHSYTPLLLLSADRPEELQNCGANQTIDQIQLFGQHVREFFNLEHANESFLNNNYLKRIATRAYSKAVNRKPGPVHINIPLREPLLPKRFTSDELNRYIGKLSTQLLKSNTSTIQSSQSIPSIGNNALQRLCNTLDKGNTLIICGRLSPEEQVNLSPLLGQVAQKLNCPVLIDPLSNLRFNSSAPEYFFYNYDHFLNPHISSVITDNVPFVPSCILRFGQFPLSKNLMTFLQQQECESILINPYGDWLDPIHKTSTMLHTIPARLCKQLLETHIKPNAPGWLISWQNAEQQSNDIIQQILSSEVFFEGVVIDTLLDCIPDNSLIFSGNSLAIRDFDTFTTRASAGGKSLYLYGNRGTSGIDGNLSTFFGLLASQNEPFDKINYGIAIIGDLSFYHDMNGLLISRDLAAKGYNATIVLLNNGGGGIFNYLPQHELNEFEKLWVTDTELDFQYSAKLYGLDYYCIKNKETLCSQLPSIIAQKGIQIVEVIIDQKTSVECHTTINSI